MKDFVLEDICTLITDGSHFSPQDVECGYPMFSVKDMQDDCFDYSFCKHVSEEDYKKLVANGCRPRLNDVVLAKDGSYLKTAFPITEEQDIALLSSIAILRPDTKIVDPLYLSYYLKSNEVYRTVSLNYITGTALKRIILKGIKRIPIKLPDLEKQRMIARQLKLLQQIIKLRNVELNRFDELIKARFVELFEDGESPLKTVEELCSTIVDCPHTTPRYEGELKNPAIRTSEIKKGYITWDSMRYVSDEEYEERIARLRPEAGDIVYGREGTFGNAAVLPEGYRFCLGQRVMLLRPDYTKCTSEYLLHAVISDDVYRQAVGKNNASTVAHVNVKDVKQFKIPLPSFDKQHKFADFVKQVDKSKSVVQKSLDEAQLLFDSLMQQYFG